MSLQKQIFEQIISRHITKSEAIDTLTVLLKTSKASLYRKMSDSTALKPEEITLLAQHYGFSLDELIEENSSQYLFSYLESLLPFTFQGQTQEVEAPLVLDISDKSIVSYYTGLELPIYYLCYYPELLHFKKHIWKRVNVDGHQHNYDLIDFSQITKEERLYYQEGIRYYEQINTVELWDENAFSLIIEQIKYAFYVGILTYEDANMLISLLERLINRLERMLRAGSKDINDQNHNNLMVYFNPISSANSLYIVDNLTAKFVLSTFAPPNSLMTTNPNLIKNVKKRFNALKRQSHLISFAGDIQRQKLLETYRKQLDKLKIQLDF